MEILRFSCPKMQFSLPEIRFFPTAFQLSSMAFRLSSTAFHFSSTAFRFPQWLSALQEIQENLSNFPQWLSSFQEIRENLSTAASIKKIHYSSFVFPATCSPSFVISVTMSTSHPTHSCGASVFPTVHQTLIEI